MKGVPALACCSCGCCGCSPSFRRSSAQTHATVRVTVTLQDGTPARDASVRVLNAGIAGTTDAAGSLTFDAVPSGRYEIEAALAGYVPATARVRVASEAIDVALHLGPPAIAERVDVFGRADDRETTALKTPTPIEEVPYSISTVPAERIELQKAQSLNEALRYTAGVQAEQYRRARSGVRFSDDPRLRREQSERSIP